MRALAPLERSPIGLYDEIVAAKQEPLQQRLRQLRIRIVGAYASYNASELHFLRSVPTSEHEKTDLRHCYNVPTAPLKHVREALKQLARSVCPYCGIDTPETIDHYLPKEVFPEFSVCLLNLIPTCYICNVRKGTAVPEGQRVFLHAYYDRIPEDALCLNAEIKWNQGHPHFVFNLEPHANLPAETFATVQSHVRRLQLLEWYAKKAGEEFDYGDLMESAISIDKLAEVARRYSEKRVRIDGPLSWRAALWRAVAGDQDILQFLFNRISGVM